MAVIDLEKKVENVTISLAKAGITKVPPLRVAAVYDDSYSMKPLYANGAVQKAADQVLAVGMKFDDDGQVDSFKFHNEAYYVGTQDENQFGTFVKEAILSRNDLWGGTSYGAGLKAVMDFFFGAGVRSTAFVPGAKKKGLFGFGGQTRGTYETKTFKSEGTDPVMVMFFTDGEQTDGMAAAQIIAAAEKANQPIYFNLIGVGNATNFAYLKKLADDYDNCGFVHLKGFDLTDSQIYDALLGTEEVVAFLRKHGAS
ncbi:hypothetical protein MARCHEWKA_04330 [Brevundimonas phage vB_BpoS-Marchewka]|uniref:VWFA domain-containing protein n=1 Tax=Brevundimonas phage vB_BpoS-Marchewka TaxID=2948604 RepID=A0A9E7N4U0_9CAUD|nr:hypothetical protein MARCHEWKA_04330 [Brevundimonas phage vB_BpoS-Marchewka]UTC29389.1 hypothetical protein BAMBUS_03070 [Brevundimonas phage vB_BpoS-Bambus]